MQNIIGMTIGNYLILEPIDDGGVASVYRAKSNKDGNLIALKVLKKESVATEKLGERFLQEAEMMAGLHHPNIIDVIDTGDYEGRPYMVLKYMTGGSLATKTQAFSLAEIVRLLKQVGSALDYAHARNTIHRDIKLENILLDEEGNAVLIDFGMAKSILPEDANKFSTGTGVILGTPFYLSPEQCKFQPVDARSDVYSLGIAVFHMLTGEFPFTGRAPAAVMMKHLNEPPPMVNILKPEYSEALAKVVNKALAKSPEDRYQSAGEFAAAFAEAAGTPHEESHKASSIKLPPALILGIAVILIIVIAIGFVWLISAMPA